MKIKNDKKVVVTGRKVCLVAGILSWACGFYWLIRALAFDDTNLPAILLNFAIAMFLIRYGSRR